MYWMSCSQMGLNLQSCFCQRKRWTKKTKVKIKSPWKTEKVLRKCPENFQYGYQSCHQFYSVSDCLSPYQRVGGFSLLMSGFGLWTGAYARRREPRGQRDLKPKCNPGSPTTIFYRLVYEPPFCKFKGLSSLKGNHHFLNGGWLPGD